MAETTVKPTTKKKAKRSVASGAMHIKATFNNTLITFTDKKGNALTTASAGAMGFKGSKKGTAYAAQVASEKAATAAKQTFGMHSVEVYVKGVGLGRDAAIRALQNVGMSVEKILDKTGEPHGGVRPRKARRA